MGYVLAAAWGATVAGWVYATRRRSWVAAAAEVAARWARRLDRAVAGDLADVVYGSGAAAVGAAAALRVWPLACYGAAAVTVARRAQRRVDRDEQRADLAAVAELRREVRAAVAAAVATGRRVDGTAARLDAVLAEILYSDDN